MARYLVSAIAFLSLLAFADSQRVTVQLTLDPAELGPEAADIAMTCAYDVEGVESDVSRVDWQMTPKGDDAPAGIYNSATGLKDDFPGTIDDIADVTNSEHSMTLKEANWCNSEGVYDCYAGVEDPAVRDGEMAVTLAARKDSGKVTVNEEEADGNIQVDEATGPVNCCAKWNSANVRVVLTDIDNNETAEANGEATGDDCTNEACASLTYEFNESVGSREYTCQVFYEDEEVDETEVGVYFGQPIPTTTEPPVEGSAAFQTIHVLLGLVTLLASFA